MCCINFNVETTCLKTHLGSESMKDLQELEESAIFAATPQGIDLKI